MIVHCTEHILTRLPAMQRIQSQRLLLGTSADLTFFVRINGLIREGSHSGCFSCCQKRLGIISSHILQILIVQICNRLFQPSVSFRQFLIGAVCRKLHLFHVRQRLLIYFHDI